MLGGAVLLAAVGLGVAGIGPKDHPAAAVAPTPMVITQDPILTSCGVGPDGVSDPKYVDLSFGGTVSVVIDWGDGTQSTANSAGIVAHTYADTSAHTITITGTFERFGQWQYSGEGRQCFTGVTQWGDTGVTSLAEGFQKWQGLRSIPATLPASVTDLRYLFANRDFTAQMNTAVATWNTANVTEFAYMFSNTDFTGDVSGWDVHNATMLKAMFGADAQLSPPLFNRSLASWNLKDGVDMTTGFGCPPGWSTANWTASLVGWASDPTPAHNVQLDACGKQWYDSAQSSRNYLVNTLGWIITNDGGSVPSPPTSSSSTTQATTSTTSSTVPSPSSSTLPSSPIGGGLAPGTARALVGGQLVDVPVTTGPDGSLRLSVAGETLTVPAGSFRPGGTFTIVGSGALAGSTVTIQFFSTPQVLASVNVPSGGAYSVNATIPAEASSGTHALQMVTTAADGTPVIVELGVTVAGSGDLPSTGAVLWPAMLGVVMLGLGALGVIARRRFANMT